MKECFSQTRGSARTPSRSQTTARARFHQRWVQQGLQPLPAGGTIKNPSATSFSTGRQEGWIYVLTHFVVIAAKLWDCLSPTSKHKPDHFFFLSRILSIFKCLFQFDNGLHFKDSTEEGGFMEMQWMALHPCSVQPEAKRWKQGKRKRLQNQGGSFCIFFHINQLLFWGDKPELLLLLLLSSCLCGVWVLFLCLVVSVQCRYWPDLRITAQHPSLRSMRGHWFSHSSPGQSWHLLLCPSCGDIHGCERLRPLLWSSWQPS